MHCLSCDAGTPTPASPLVTSGPSASIAAAEAAVGKQKPPGTTSGVKGPMIDIPGEPSAPVATTSPPAAAGRGGTSPTRSGAARRASVRAALVNESLAIGGFDGLDPSAEGLLRVSSEDAAVLPAALDALPTTPATPKSPLQMRMDSPLLSKAASEPVRHRRCLCRARHMAACGPHQPPVAPAVTGEQRVQVPGDENSPAGCAPAERPTAVPLSPRGNARTPITDAGKRGLPRTAAADVTPSHNPNFLPPPAGQEAGTVLVSASPVSKRTRCVALPALCAPVEQDVDMAAAETCDSPLLPGDAPCGGGDSGHLRDSVLALDPLRLSLAADGAVACDGAPSASLH